MADSTSTGPSIEQISMLVDMGFSPAQARKALRVTVSPHHPIWERFCVYHVSCPCSLEALMLPLSGSSLIRTTHASSSPRLLNLVPPLLPPRRLSSVARYRCRPSTVLRHLSTTRVLQSTQGVYPFEPLYSSKESLNLAPILFQAITSRRSSRTAARCSSTTRRSPRARDPHTTTSSRRRTCISSSGWRPNGLSRSEGWLGIGTNDGYDDTR